MPIISNQAFKDAQTDSSYYGGANTGYREWDLGYQQLMKFKTLNPVKYFFNKLPPEMKANKKAIQYFHNNRSVAKGMRYAINGTPAPVVQSMANTICYYSPLKRAIWRLLNPKKSAKIDIYSRRSAANSRYNSFNNRFANERLRKPRFEYRLSEKKEWTPSASSSASTVTIINISMQEKHAPIVAELDVSGARRLEARSASFMKSIKLPSKGKGKGKGKGPSHGRSLSL